MGHVAWASLGGAGAAVALALGGGALVVAPAGWQRRRGGEGSRPRVAAVVPAAVVGGRVCGEAWLRWWPAVPAAPMAAVRLR